MPPQVPIPQPRLCSFPSNVDEIKLLFTRGVKTHGALHLSNTPVPAEDGTMPAEPEPNPLLPAIKEAKAGAIVDPNEPFVDFVWNELVVPPAPPPPAEDAQPPAEDAPPVPTPAELAAGALRERLPVLWQTTCEFQQYLAQFKVSTVPEFQNNYDTGYYTRMMDTIPVPHITVPLVLDVMFEQVCLNQKGPAANDEARPPLALAL